MTDALTLTVLPKDTHLEPQAFDRAYERLQAALTRHTDAANSLAEARCSLEFKRAELLCGGVDNRTVRGRKKDAQRVLNELLHAKDLGRLVEPHDLERLL